MIDDLITEIMRAEGWDKYTNRPNDRGGPTKWGITLAAWGHWRGRVTTADDIKDITESQARDFYEKLYVIGPRFHQLPERLIPLVVDSGVNHGTHRASKWVQLAVGARADGIIGPKTIAAVQAANPVSTHLRISASRIKLYGRIVTKDPTQAEFAWGWNRRAAKFLTALAQSLE